MLHLDGENAHGGSFTSTLLSSIVEEEEDWRNVRIYRLPIYMKEMTREDFVPLELFVGFYNHTELVIEDGPMHLDITKLAIAREFCRGPGARPGSIINPQVWTDFLVSIGPQLKTAREQYDRLKYDASKVDRQNEVVAMDALFIVAYLRFNFKFDDTWGYDFEAVFQRSRFNAQRFPLLHDLLKLENQVPILLLLSTVNNLCKQVAPSSDLYELLEWFVMAVYPFNHGTKPDVSPDSLLQHLEGSHKSGGDAFENCHHLLDCAYRAICGPDNPFPTRRSNSPTCPRSRFRIPSATSLERVGISVKVKGNSLTMNRIQFVRRNYKYVLILPKLIMHDYTASMFRNLALYEQTKDNGICSRGDMRTYLYLMSSLLESVHDVHLLINRGVILNQLGSARAVCKEWNRMCDGLYIPSRTPDYWSYIQTRISELEKSKSHRWFAEVEERHFSSFVIFGSFVALSIAFVATIVSTVYQVLSFYAAV